MSIMKTKRRLADYVPTQLLEDWLAEVLPRAMDALELRKNVAIIERIVRVEEGMKAVNERLGLLMHQMDKRFAALQWTIGIGFTVIVALMSLYQFVK